MARSIVRQEDEIKRSPRADSNGSQYETVTGDGYALRTQVREDVAVVDPREAHQNAVEAGLVIRQENPLNCETPLESLRNGATTPNARFYIRDHFEIPKIEKSGWRLRVGGLVERPLSLRIEDLMSMRAQTMAVMLECAGNGRTLFDPPVQGEKWELGAVSIAEWTGVPLVEVLDRAGIRAPAFEVVFRGADRGMAPGRTERINFERSLSIDEASNPEILLAYAMNGKPLPIEHGYPLRLVVPGWYGMASVKWLSAIEVIDHPFMGHYQANAYVYEWKRNGEIVREPVRLQQVRSLITEPGDTDEIERGELAIRGIAWSGAAPIAGVEVSIADGPWQEAGVIGEPREHGWQRWELITRIDTRGAATIRARARDATGRVQPERPEWNRLGYGNNAVQLVQVRVR